MRRSKGVSVLRMNYFRAICVYSAVLSIPPDAVFTIPPSWPGILLGVVPTASLEEPYSRVGSQGKVGGLLTPSTVLT